MDNEFSKLLWTQFLKRLSTHGSVYLYAELGIMSTLKIKGKNANGN